MFRKIRKILIAVTVLGCIFAGYVALQPAAANMVRMATIAAPPAEVFARVNDLHKWQEWSPWARLDPDAKVSYEGPQAGYGAAFLWSGNSDVGEGKMTLVESKPNEKIKFRIDLLKPMAGSNTSEFSFEPDGNSTYVIWRMTGERTFLQRALCIIFGAEKIAGDQFEQGLANLDAAVTGKVAAR